MNFSSQLMSGFMGLTHAKFKKKKKLGYTIKWIRSSLQARSECLGKVLSGHISKVEPSGKQCWIGLVLLIHAFSGFEASITAKYFIKSIGVQTCKVLIQSY